MLTKPRPHPPKTVHNTPQVECALKPIRSSFYCPPAPYLHGFLPVEGKRVLVHDGDIVRDIVVRNVFHILHQRDHRIVILQQIYKFIFIFYKQHVSLYLNIDLFRNMMYVYFQICYVHSTALTSVMP